MVSTWKGPAGDHWQCDKCKQTGGPFESQPEAHAAGKEHECSAQDAPEPRQPPRK